MNRPGGFELYSVLPSIGDTRHHLGATYRESVVAAARLADRFGYTGALLHYNLHQVDPWCLVPLVLESTHSLVPLVATPATAFPPHTLARTITAMAAIYGRRVAVNVVTGADPAELAAIGDDADHDSRYGRAAEHIGCLRSMLAGERPVRASGSGWSYLDFVLDPPMGDVPLPEIFVAGSSPAGLATAVRIGDVAVTHATDPAAEEMTGFLDTVRRSGLDAGIRLGIIARPESGEAWRLAEERFPRSRLGELTAMRKLESESHWMRSLARHALGRTEPGGRLSLRGFAAARSHAAYVIGDYDEVADILADYRALGVSRLLLDGPYDEPEFAHTREALDRLPAERPEAGARR